MIKMLQKWIFDGILRWLWKFFRWLRGLEWVGSLRDLFNRKRPWNKKDGFHCVRCGLADADGSRAAVVKEALNVVEGAFDRVANVELRSSHCVVEKASAAKGAREIRMRRRAEKILKAWAGHLAVVAQVLQSGKQLKLWFLPREGDGAFARGHHQPPYYLAAQANLEEDFYDAFHEKIEVEVLKAEAKFANVRVPEQMPEGEVRG